MNVRDELIRAHRQAPAVAPDLEALHRRRERRARWGRAGTVSLALVVGFSAIGGAWWAFRAEDAGTSVGAGPKIGPPTVDLTIGDGELYHLRVHSTADYSGGGSSDHQEATYRTWWATDGSGRLENLDGRWYDEGEFGPGGFRSDTGPVADLSTDPAQLEAQLRVRVEPGGASPEPYENWGGPVEWGLIRSIRELLLAPDLSPAVKAALVEVAANLDGVTVDDRAIDPAGRAAILLSTHTEQKLNEWWFDASSHQLLAMRETFDEGGLLIDVVEAAGVAGSTDSDRLGREFVPAVI